MPNRRVAQNLSIGRRFHALGNNLRRENGCSFFRSQSLRVAGSTTSTVQASASDTDAIAFCLDSAVADLSYLTISVAYNAAQQLWPGRVVGPVGLYVDKAKTILPVLAEPYHTVVLVRLLSDEGVIGARSTAGREGPVVGRAVRHTGSRPLLVAEIAEHWPVVMDSCLLRWSLEAQRREQAQGQVQLGRSNRDDLLVQAHTAYKTAEVAMMADVEAMTSCISRVNPHFTAVEALKGCSRGPLLLTSTLPVDLGLRVLDRCGLVVRPSELEVVFEPSWSAVVSRVVGTAAARGGRVQMVTGNLARLEQLLEASVAPGEAAAAEGCSVGSGGDGGAGGGWQPEEVGGRLGGMARAEDDGAVAVASANVGGGGVVGELTRWADAAETNPAAARPDASSACVDAPSAHEDAPSGATTRFSKEQRSRQTLYERDACGHKEEAGTGRPSAPSPSPPPPSSGRPLGASESAGEPTTLREPQLPAARREAARLGSPVSGGAQAGAQGVLAGAKLEGRGRGSEDSADEGAEQRSRAPGAAEARGTMEATAPNSQRTEGAEARVPDDVPPSGAAPLSPWPTLRTVHLAEWSCTNMSYRARALSYMPRASLLSEHQLAEWLEVTHLDVVMDGVAWR